MGFRQRLVSDVPLPRAAWIALAALYVNIVSGALVRLTGSGLGCPEWPTCSKSSPVPQLSGHALIEYTNRVLAFAVIVITIWCAVVARRHRGEQPRAARLALAIAIGTFAQGPLGGITVLTDLHPVAVMSHFVLAVAIIAAGVLLVIEVWKPPAFTSQPGGVVGVSVVFALWTLALVASGAVVTMAGPHPGDRSLDIPRLWTLTDAAYWHVRIAVTYVFLLAAYLALASRRRHLAPRVVHLAWLVVALVASQIAIGEYQWRHQLPWQLVLAHVATGTALWVSAVALARYIGGGARRLG